MKKILLLSFLILPMFCAAKPKVVKLFNGKNLKNWEIYTPATSVVKDGPLFSVVKQDGMTMIRISGEVNSSLATKEEYENYHLQMVFRWGDKVYKQKNSGILYHSYGPFGEGLGVWMSAHEFQLCTGKIGDSYCMGNSYFEVPSALDPDGKTWRFSQAAAKNRFGTGFPAKNCAKLADHEKPQGEWNVVDLYCFGANSIHVVNGVVNMMNYGSGSVEKDGSVLPLVKGRIQVQSEGGELFIKSLTLEKIDRMPEQILK